MGDPELEIDASMIKRLLLKVYRDYKRGELTKDEAYQEAFILNSVLRAAETAEIEERLQRIEKSIRDV